MESPGSEDLVGYHLAPGDIIETCPYNSSHKVRKMRMSIHLGKCRAEYGKKLATSGETVDYFNCKYNYFHKIPGPEVLRHHEICPDRSSVLSRVSRTPAFVQGSTTPQ